MTAVFCDVDDCCQRFEQAWSQQQPLPSMLGAKRSQSRLRLSEVMTMVIAFHGSGMRTFKDFYTLTVRPHWRNAFPNWVSDNRFVALMPWCLLLLCCCLNTRRGALTGIAFIDSTPLEVCHPARAHAHQVFKHQVGWGQSSTGWKFGFKLHLIINERGARLAFKLTPAHTDDRQPVPELTQGLCGQLFGDRGYIAQKLFEERYERGLQLVTKAKKNMKQRLVKLMDKILLRQRALIESVNDQLKNICQIEHSRLSASHTLRARSGWNFLVNLVAGLIAYTYQPKLPSLD